MNIPARINQLQAELRELQARLIMPHLEDELAAQGELYEHTTIDNWTLTTSDPEAGDYIYIEHKDHPGVIEIKAGDEGFSVAIYGADDDAKSVTETWAMYNELEHQEP